MSDLDRYLTRCELLDCQGRTEHALTLLVDGRVEVRGDAARYTIDPRTGRAEPARRAIPEHVLHAAASMVGHAIPAAPNHR